MATELVKKDNSKSMDHISSLKISESDDDTSWYDTGDEAENVAYEPHIKVTDNTASEQMKQVSLIKASLSIMSNMNRYAII